MKQYSIKFVSSQRDQTSSLNLTKLHLSYYLYQQKNEAKNVTDFNTITLAIGLFCPWQLPLTSLSLYLSSQTPMKN
jgi:hypothetical protein